MNLKLMREKSGQFESKIRLAHVQSHGKARLWIKGFAKYLAIFSRREESSPLFNLSSPNTKSLN